MIMIKSIQYVDSDEEDKKYLINCYLSDVYVKLKFKIITYVFLSTKKSQLILHSKL